MVQAAVRVSRLSREATSSTALALTPLHNNLALAPVSPTPPQQALQGLRAAGAS